MRMQGDEHPEAMQKEMTPFGALRALIPLRSVSKFAFVPRIRGDELPHRELSAWGLAPLDRQHVVPVARGRNSEDTWGRLIYPSFI